VCLAGDTQTACGGDGHSCAACSTTLSCDNHVCTCNDQSECAAGQACKSNQCGTSCDLDHPCKDGCCDNGFCVVAKADAEEALACLNSSLTPFCLGDGQCGCRDSFDCVSQGLVCDPSTRACVPCQPGTSPTCAGSTYCAADVKRCKPTSLCTAEGCADPNTGACRPLETYRSPQQYVDAAGLCAACGADFPVRQDGACVPCDPVSSPCAGYGNACYSNGRCGPCQDYGVCRKGNACENTSGATPQRCVNSDSDNTCTTCNVARPYCGAEGCYFCNSWNKCPTGQYCLDGVCDPCTTTNKCRLNSWECLLHEAPFVCRRDSDKTCLICGVGADGPYCRDNSTTCDRCYQNNQCPDAPSCAYRTCSGGQCGFTFIPGICNPGMGCASWCESGTRIGQSCECQCNNCVEPGGP